MNRYAAEVLGTFCLVFFGTGAIVVGLSHLAISIVFGLVVMVMILSLGNVSSAHINPAVSIGFWTAGKIETKDVAAYISCQLGGVLLQQVFCFCCFFLRQKHLVKLSRKLQYQKLLYLKFF